MRPPTPLVYTANLAEAMASFNLSASSASLWSCGSVAVLLVLNIMLNMVRRRVGMG